MKYTLIVFQLHPVELKHHVVQTNPSEIAIVLGETGKYRADICEGIYVFETVKGWKDMHRLRTWLTLHQKTFVELPFESALAGFFPPSVVDKLTELGKKSGQEISLLNLHE